MNNNFYFYTDGATEPTNPGPSSYAFIEMQSPHDNHEIYSYSRYIGHSTNNIAELSAISDVLKYILNDPQLYLHKENKIVIYSDSQYARDCIIKWYPSWVAKNKLSDKKNLDIIASANKDFFYIKELCDISIEWVKGHSGVWGNERCDELCELEISKNNPTYVSTKSKAYKNLKTPNKACVHTDGMVESIIDFIRADPSMLDDLSNKEIIEGFIDITK